LSEELGLVSLVLGPTHISL